MTSTSSLIHAFYDKVCAENLPKVPLFGVSLDKYMESQKRNIPFLDTPFVLRKCCHFLQEKGMIEYIQVFDHALIIYIGLETEGIFRVPGSQTTVEKIVDLFEQGK